MLLILIVLAPLQALDTVLIATFAAFSKSKSIFVRKHLLTPGLRLAAVVVVVALSGDVEALADRLRRRRGAGRPALDPACW